jgi:hypothetical protein
MYWSSCGLIRPTELPYTTKYVYVKSTTVFVPSSELGLSQPSLASECAPPPRTGGGGTLAWGEGLGESQFRRQEKSLALCLLCALHLI